MKLSRTGCVLALGLAMVGLPSAAHADTVGLVAYAGGQRVTIGDVIGSGERQGDTCLFASPVSVTLESAGRIRLDIDDDCQIVVTSMSTDVTTFPLPQAGTTRACRDRTAGDLVQDLVKSAPETELQWGVSTAGSRVGYVTHRIYDEFDTWMFEESYAAAYTRSGGRFTSAGPRYGLAQANPNPAPWPTPEVGINEVVDCAYDFSKTSTSIDMRGDGVFRRHVGAANVVDVTFMRILTTSLFNALANGGLSCTAGVDGERPRSTWSEIGCNEYMP